MLRSQLIIYLKNVDESIIKTKKVAFLFFENLLTNVITNDVVILVIGYN